MEINIIHVSGDGLPLIVKLALVVMAALPLLAWGTYFVQFRREGHGIWARSSPVLLALAPCWVGVATATLGLGNTTLGLTRAGAGIYWAAAAVTEVMEVLIFGCVVSAVVLLTAFVWILRLPSGLPLGVPGRSAAPIAVLALALCLVAVLSVGYWIPYTAEAPFAGSSTLYVCAGLAAAVAMAFVVAPLLPGWAPIGRRGHMLLAFWSITVLLSAGVASYLIARSFYLLATGRLT